MAYLSEGSDAEVKQKMLRWMLAFQERLGLDKRRMDIWECGLRWAVEAKRKEAFEGKNEEHERVQMAPSMEAGGSHPQATLTRGTAGK